MPPQSARRMWGAKLPAAEREFQTKSSDPPPTKTYVPRLPFAPRLFVNCEKVDKKLIGESCRLSVATSAPRLPERFALVPASVVRDELLDLLLP